MFRLLLFLFLLVFGEFLNCKKNNYLEALTRLKLRIMEFILSIVIPTLGRIKEVDSLLSSIYSFPIENNIKAEIIVVDQNFSNVLDGIVSKYSEKGFPIRHYKVSFRGTSKAKNFGTSKAKGKYICFVDDDAEFKEDTINIALKELEKGYVDIVTGRCVDRNGIDSVQKFSDEEALLTLDNFEGKFIESTMFYKIETFQKYFFDEKMGVGCFYGAEEGYDIVYRMLKDGISIKYNPNIKFYHPHTVVDKSSEVTIRRAFTYRCGFGYLCRKYKFKKKYYVRIAKLLAYLFVLPFYKPREFKFYLADFLGSVVGYVL